MADLRKVLKECKKCYANKPYDKDMLEDFFSNPTPRYQKYKSLHQELPLQVRYEVYLLAIAYYTLAMTYKNYNRIVWLNGDFGLCLVLPKVFWGLKHVMDCAPNGNSCAYTDADKAFTDINVEYVAESTKICSIPEDFTFRKQYLTGIVDEILSNNKLSTTH